MRLSRIVLLILAAVAVGFVSSDQAAAATYQGDGTSRTNRLPWLDETTRELRQGWGACDPSHCKGNAWDEYGTDWGGSFAIYAATEGDATCSNLNDGWGVTVRIDRFNDARYDRYSHLPSCPFTGTKHYEQGDYIGMTGCTGICSGTHLHFQQETGTRAAPISKSHTLSGLTFCDQTQSGFCTGNFGHDWFTSDNAGPGVNLAGDLQAWMIIKDKHDDLGHYFAGLGLCAGSSSGAWHCFGASANYANSGRPARYGCAGSPVNDCGWHQEFREAASAGGEYHDFNWPTACPAAYWVPDGFYIARTANPNLGQARSSVIYLSYPFNFYVQYFRNGFLCSATFGGSNPSISWSPTSTCNS